MQSCFKKVRKHAQRTTKTANQTSKTPISFAPNLDELRYAHNPRNVGFYTTPDDIKP